MTTGKKKKRYRRAHLPNPSAAHRDRERDQETIRLVNEASEDCQDLQRLRRLAAVRGLVNSDLRARLWVALSGADVDAVGRDEYLEAAAGAHRDSGTVKVDVARSLWSFMPGAGEAEREERRDALARLLNAVVVHHGGDVHYYQGLHDVASVLLLVAGERPAFAILCRLATCALRDATRPTLDPVLELLGLMDPLLEAADPELAALSRELGLPPYYALSWFITWFSHSAPSLDAAARLFDVFLSAHPLMPLYVGAAAMASQRDKLLAAGRGDGGMPGLHTALTNLDVTHRLCADDLACEALSLYRRLRPEAIVARRTLRLEMSVAPHAFRDGALGTWRVPEPSRRVASIGAVGGGKVPPWNRQLQQALERLLPGSARRAPPAAALLHAALYTAMAAGVLIVMRLQPGGGPTTLPWG